MGRLLEFSGSTVVCALDFIDRCMYPLTLSVTLLQRM